jgi:hypothetical protein
MPRSRDLFPNKIRPISTLEAEYAQIIVVDVLQEVFRVEGTFVFA